jgi:pyridoxamine 5'-phosphate oxidase
MRTLSDMADPIQDMRVDYGKGALHERDMDRDPIAQFARWFDEARASGIIEPNAMTLATVDAEGRPQARIVLLKGFDARGFTFFTNYDSAKGRELAANPHATLVFFWDRLERSVRITGSVARTTRAESQDYFKSRPYRSRLGACVSQQSSVVADRDVLERWFAELAATYPEGSDVPCPEHWGGYRVTPHTVEFWQGQRSRLHDRLRYTRRSENDWILQRLSP